MISRFLLCALLCFLLVLQAAAYIPDVLPEDPAKGIVFPPVQVGIIKGSSCGRFSVIKPAMNAFINATIYADDGTPIKEAKPIFTFLNKRIHGVKRFNFIPGVELGIVDACSRQRRSIRFPAELGFPEGLPRYHLLPNTPLKAIVDIIACFYVDEADMEVDKLFKDGDIDFITEGKGLKKLVFTDLKTVSTAKELDRATKGKHALIYVYTSWCGPCRFAEPEMKEAATQLSRGVGGDVSQAVTVLGIDATNSADKILVKEFDAAVYPAIFVQLQGGLRVQYHGQRTAKDIVSFVEAEVARRETSEATDRDL